MAERSKIKQMADAEAEAAEKEAEEESEFQAPPGAEDENPDAEAAEPTPAGEPAEDAEPSAEAVQAALENVHGHYVASLHEVLQEAMDDMVECPACNALGFRPLTAMPLDPDNVRCDKCAGWGSLLTEAQDPNHVVRQCDACMGNGYRPRPAEYVPPPPNGTQPVGTPVSEVTIPPMPFYDPSTNTWKAPDGRDLQVVG